MTKSETGIPSWFIKDWQYCIPRIRYAGRYLPVKKISPSPRDHWTFLHLTRGAIELRASRFDIRVGAGQTCIIPPANAVERIPVGKPAQTAAVEVGFDLVCGVGGTNPLVRLSLPVPLDMGGDPEYRGLYDRLLVCFPKWTPTQGDSCLRARTILDELLLRYLHRGFEQSAFVSPGAASDPIPEWVQTLIDRTTRSLQSRDTSVQSLVKEAGYSRAFVHRQFKRYTRETLGNFLRRNRMTWAAKDLAGNTMLSIANVADACGYKSQALFNRHFKRATGMTPGEYRRQHAGGVKKA